VNDESLTTVKPATVGIRDSCAGRSRRLGGASLWSETRHGRAGAVPSPGPGGTNRDEPSEREPTSPIAPALDPSSVTAQLRHRPEVARDPAAPALTGRSNAMRCAAAVRRNSAVYLRPWAESGQSCDRSLHGMLRRSRGSDLRQTTAPDPCSDERERSTLQAPPGSSRPFRRSSGRRRDVGRCGD
jgi:hypothetical protein